MIEKVNPSHPDKVADRIAGAIVDLAYTKEENPKIAVEVLIGHRNCNVIVETSAKISKRKRKSKKSQQNVSVKLLEIAKWNIKQNIIFQNVI